MDFARVMRGSNFAQRAGVATLDFVKAFSKRFQQSSWNAFRCDTFADIVLPHGHISLFGGVAVAAVAVLGVFWSVFWFSHRHGYFFFDPQDCFRAKPEGRVFPASAETATFEPMLKHYIGVTQLLVMVAAASIAFGGSGPTLGTPIVIAKLLLAWSIFYGVLFCALLLWRYDEYAQDMESYTLGWYSTVFGFGFSSLTCFMFGYLAWGWGLSRIVS